MDMEEALKQNRYSFLKAVLILQTVGLLVYTIVAMKNDGINFLIPGLEFIQSLKWEGQFTLDFNCYLILCSLWILWRNKFAYQSILIALVANILGIIVFAPYLLYLLAKEKNDLVKVLIGER